MLGNSDKLNKKISIIVPIYNCRDYIERCIDSLLDQSYQGLEIILINDGSTDGVEEILDRYRQENRIIIINQENRGVSAARNAGLDIATGDYIGFVDADDYAAREMYSTLLEKALEADADITQCAMLCISEGREQVAYAPKSERLIKDIGRSSKELFRLLCYGCCSKLYKRETVEGIRFDGSYPVGEDLLFNLRALKNAKGLLFLPDALYYYERRADSATHTAIEGERLLSFRNMLKQAESEQESPTIKEYILRCQLNNNTDVISKIILSATEDHTDVVEEIRRECRKKLGFILFGSGLAFKQKIKLLGIGCFYGCYRSSLLRKKGADYGRK